MITLPLRCQGVNVIFLCITTEAWPSILQTHLLFSQTRPLAVSTTTSLYPRTSAPTVTATNIFPYLWPVEYLLIIPDSDQMLVPPWASKGTPLWLTAIISQKSIEVSHAVLWPPIVLVRISTIFVLLCFYFVVSFSRVLTSDKAEFKFWLWHLLCL